MMFNRESRKGPCYQCKERYQHCTDTCEKHHEYYGKIRKIRESIREEQEINSVLIEGARRQGRVTTKGRNKK